MNKTRTKAVMISVFTALALMFVSGYVAFECYYPVYKQRAIRALKVVSSKHALENMISDHGSASAASLRSYHNKGLSRGLALLSEPSPPDLDPPVLLYVTLLMPEAKKEGIIYLLWLEYDFDVNGITLEFDDGSAVSCDVFPIWKQSDRDWFGALAHRDFAVKVLDGPEGVQSTLPNTPTISEPLDRLRQLRRVRLHLLSGRVSAPVNVFVVPEELRGTKPRGF